MSSPFAALGEVSDIRLCLPVTGLPETPLVFYHWHPGQPLDTGPYQTRQPFANTQPVIPDLILVPLLAFDKNFNRLGYGGGFYDRTLANFARTAIRWWPLGSGSICRKWKIYLWGHLIARWMGF